MWPWNEWVNVLCCSGELSDWIECRLKHMRDAAAKQHESSSSDDDEEDLTQNDASKTHTAACESDSVVWLEILTNKNVNYWLTLKICCGLWLKIIICLIFTIHVFENFRNLPSVMLLAKFGLLYYCYYYYYHFMAPWTVSGTSQVSRYQKGKTRKLKLIWIYGMRQWVAVASAGPYANLHLASDR